MPRILVNGQPEDVPDNASVGQLVAQLKLTGQPVAVELNKELVPRRCHQETILHEGDTVEVVTLVGGG
jgi:thiamine biosynthesis protein ThiS